MRMYDHESGNNLLNLVFTLMEFLVSTILVYLVAVSFGAYLIEDFLATLIFSIFLSLISVMPFLIMIKHKSPIELLERLLFRQEYKTNIEQALSRVSRGSIIGAWFGALVIPLDWDKWWQKWPISCIIGAVVGILVSLLINLIKLKKKVKLDS
ncbi:phosphatidylinositol-glycan biosynthesis class F [Brachionus plicatilis]|uniref:Phosphatidylinositol-glycan biosynthesis class F n=1 Tax=Brachionus plicatilis TaxID=10195 RepID=A0A3M7R8T1_BRAPC|nr:phosphatidylinositol-glycan biosynthesis class F [Brachionus plicatilis]